MSRGYSRIAIVSVGLAVVLACIGCGPGTSESGGYETAPVSVPPAPSPVPVVREVPDKESEEAEPATEKKARAPRAKEIPEMTPPNAAPLPVLVNADFEKWDNGLPIGWQGNFPEEIEARRQVITPLRGAYGGGVALRLRAGGERRILWQPVNIPLQDFGKSITCEAHVKNPAPEALFFRLSYTVDGEEVVKEAERQEGPEWTQFRITTELPKEAEPQSVKVTFILRHFVKGAAILDGVSVKTGE